MKIACWVFALALGGCASLLSDDPVSPHYAYPTGWTIELHRALTIPANEATVRLQYGRVVPRNGVQDYDPFCVVEIDTVRDAPQTLAPGRFEVWRVTRNVHTIVDAGASPFRRVHMSDDGDPPFLYFITEFRLRDPAQPGLRGMTCAWNQMAPGNRVLMRHLTLAEIRSALGDWMSLTPERRAGRRA